MALTVKLIDEKGTLQVLDDQIGLVGTGDAFPSKSQEGYITLKLDLRKRVKFDLKKGVVRDEFLVIRVPIDWTNIA